MSIHPFTIHSSLLQADEEARVYLPPHYDPAKRYPVIYLHMTYPYFERLDLPLWLDEQITAGMDPLIVIGLPTPEAITWWLPGTEGATTFGRFVVQEVIPAVEQAYAVQPGRRLLALSSGAVVALDLVTDYPDAFVRVALQSPGWLLRVDDQLTSHLDDALRRVSAVTYGALPPLWFCWGDSTEDEWEVRSRENAGPMIAALQGVGATVEHQFFPGGHNLTMMRASMPDAISFLLRS